MGNLRISLLKCAVVASQEADEDDFSIVSEKMTFDTNVKESLHFKKFLNMLTRRQFDEQWRRTAGTSECKFSLSASRRVS